jgi:hypothetical protein
MAMVNTAVDFTFRSIVSSRKHLSSFSLSIIQVGLKTRSLISNRNMAKVTSNAFDTAIWVETSE